jgi:hydrogenase-4 component F
MGILVLAAGVGGMAAFGGLLHAVNNAFNKGILFLAAGNVLQSRRTAEVRDVRGLLRSNPWTGGCLVIGFLAATGFPPFGTFLSEFTILRGMIGAGQVLVPVLFLLFLAIVFVGMGTIVLEMAQGEAPEPALPRDRPALRDSFVSVLPMLAMVAIVLLLGVALPAPLRELIEQASGWTGGLR